MCTRRSAVVIRGMGRYVRASADDETDAEVAAAIAALDDAGIDQAEVDAFFIGQLRPAGGAFGPVEALDPMDAAVTLLDRGGATVVVIALAMDTRAAVPHPRVAMAVVLSSSRAEAR